MTLWKNGLLLAAGGLVGLALAAILDDTDEQPKAKSEVDAMELLVEEIRSEAEWAMEECTTDEEREMVYMQVKDSVKRFQDVLQEKGEEIIADLREQAAEAPSKEEVEASVESRVQEFKKKMDGLTDTLNQTLSDLEPASAKY